MRYQLDMPSHSETYYGHSHSNSQGNCIADMLTPELTVDRKVMQTGSKALYFAQCRNQNATWLPLLEKAYAKAHGDYGSIEGGWGG